MPPQQPPQNPVSFRQRMEQVEWLATFPVLTVIVFMRREVGYRLLNPLSVMGVAVFIFFFAGLFAMSSGWQLLLLFDFFFLVLAFGQRMKRWREMSRGVRQHSYYIGTSKFNFKWIPEFCRQDRRMARYAEPVICVLCGFIIIQYARLMGVWLILSGLCLRLVEAKVRLREFDRDLDVMDGLLLSELQGEVAEHFSESFSQANQIKEQPSVISTGMSDDIASRVKKQKSRQLPPKIK